MKRILLAATLTVLGLQLGCAKKKELQDQVGSVPNSVRKADLPQGNFTLSRGIEDADKDLPGGAIPGFQESYGVYKIVITDTELQFVAQGQTEKRAEESNIIAFPITDSYDIIRQPNDYGDPTNQIVKDQKRPVKDREFIVVDWTKPKTNNFLPIAALNYSDYVKEDTVVLSKAFGNEGGIYNFVTEHNLSSPMTGKNYRLKIRTSMMPLKPSDFKPLEYPQQKFAKFGLFTTNKDFRDAFYQVKDDTLSYKANIFNVCEKGTKASCSTNKIVYIFNDGFPAEYKEGARRAVRSWNAVFQQALDRTDDIVVLDESRTAPITDPRSSMIAFYDPEAAGGLLGVSQTVVNDITGETVSARATIYGHGIRFEKARIELYLNALAEDEEFRKAFLAGVTKSLPKKLQAQNSANSGPQIINPILNFSGGIGQGLTGSKLSRLKTKFGGTSESAKSQGILAALDLSSLASSVFARSDLSSASEQKRYATLQKINPSLLVHPDLGTKIPALTLPDNALQGDLKLDPAMKGMDLLLNPEGIKKARLEEVHRSFMGLHGVDMVEDATLQWLRTWLLKNAKGMTDFSSIKAKIEEEVAQRIFYGTLVHEMGHNFALRHNFAGSSDEENFDPNYATMKASLKAEGKLSDEQKTVLKADLDGFAYSSIMDYNASLLGELAGPGPYDKAAIAFAYNRTQGEKKVLAANKAGFRFCTDEQVGEEILCRRFDKGRNINQITANTIEQFHRSYLRSHFRNDMAEFDRTSGSVPMTILQQYLVPVRLVFDELLWQLYINNDGTGCPKPIRISIEKGEIKNICDRAVAKQFKFDPADPASWQPLFTKEVAPEDYVTGGLADLLKANLMALDFFEQVMGAPDPGIYVGIESPDKQGQRVMIQIAPYVESEVNKSDDEILRLLGKAVGIGSVNEIEQFVALHRGWVARIAPGLVGKYFDSQVVRDGFEWHLKRLGFSIDKYIAFIALTNRDFGLRRYALADRDQRFYINAYDLPQTKQWLTDLTKAIATNSGGIGRFKLDLNQNQLTEQQKTAGSVPCFTDGSHCVMVRGTTNHSFRYFITALSMTRFVSDFDRNFLAEVNICDVADTPQACNSSDAERVASYETLNGTNTYRSLKPLEGEGLAFGIVSRAAQKGEMVKQVTESLKILAQDREAVARAVRKGAEIVLSPETAAAVAALDAKLKALPETEKLAGDLTSGPESAFATVVEAAKLAQTAFANGSQVKVPPEIADQEKALRQFGSRVLQALTKLKQNSDPATQEQIESLIPGVQTFFKIIDQNFLLPLSLFSLESLAEQASEAKSGLTDDEDLMNLMKMILREVRQF